MVTFLPLVADEAADRLRGCDLSDWFNPFLVRFARETLGSGGRAVAALDGSTVTGLLLVDPAERTASVFARRAEVARELAERSESPAFYAEVDLDGPREPFRIYVRTLGVEPPHRFRSAVRLLTPTVDPRVPDLLREVYGDSAERWLPVAHAEGERAVGAEVEGKLVGLAWVLVAGRDARLHGLTVRAEYRRLGIGTDLVLARLVYAHRLGARVALSEIADRNLASRATAERAGLRPVGRVYLYGRAAAEGGVGAGPGPTFG
jgi:RimJ/RimL family protein N-acetyltransferase